MTQDQPIPPFDWFANQFTFESRKEFIEQIRPHLKPLMKKGDSILDLCCGAGPITFFLEELGAEQVTGIDLVPSLIAIAHQEAIKRGSKAKFINSNVLTHSLGNNAYNLIVCFGNAILDFSHQGFSQFRDQVFHALKSGSCFVIEYFDGLLRVKQMSEPKELVEQGLNSQIVRRFVGYDPAMSIYKMEYRNLSTNETYEYTGYIYIKPLVQIIMKVRFKLVQSIQLSEWSFMDVYITR